MTTRAVDHGPLVPRSMFSGRLAMILVVVVDQKLAKRWLVPVLRGAQRALQAAGTLLKRLTG